MPQLYPLRFKPILRRYLWGGRRLHSLLGKPLGDENDYAESWEVVDHGQDQSVVLAGTLRGVTLGQLVHEQGTALLGRHHPQRQFPLLFKFLDAHRNLSVQVHPNDQQGSRLVPPDLGKTEAWVVVHADPGSKIYAGLKRGFDRSAFERELRRGTTELCLHSFEPQAGDCVFIPAGTVHALGAGLVVAEIQQASDTTFRLFDWNRVGSDGKPRQLHVEQALDVIDFDAGPVSPVSTGAEQLVACDKFVLERHRLLGPVPIGGDNRFHLLAVLAGQLDVAADPVAQPLSIGETALLPAAAEPVLTTPVGETVLLDMYLP